MNKRDREQLNEFNNKIDDLNKNLNKIGEETNNINNNILALKKKMPKWYTSVGISLMVSVFVSLLLGSAIFNFLEENQMNNVNFLFTTDGDVYISNENIDTVYNFSILNFNTDILEKDVTLTMSFNFENENISVFEQEPIIPYKEREFTRNTITYVWGYVPKKEGNVPGRIFQVFRVIRFPKTNGTMTFTDASKVAPTIVVTIANSPRNVITPPGFLWENNS